jgi:hypothetical protein
MITVDTGHWPEPEPVVRGVVRSSPEGSWSRGAESVGEGSAAEAEVARDFGRGEGPVGSGGTVSNAEGTGKRRCRVASTWWS